MKFSQGLFVTLIGLGLWFLPTAVGAVYLDPITREPILLENTNCVLTPDPAQKNDHTVYTLNIALTKQINEAYRSWWGRSARCDELQWHAEHATTYSKLASWLRQVVLQSYRDHAYDGSIWTYQENFRDPQKNSTGGAYWRLINGKRQRIPDVLTQWSWGLVRVDTRRLYVDFKFTDEVFAAYPEIEPLQYTAGPYFEQVDAMWRNHTTDVDLPQRLKDEIVEAGFGYYGLFFYRNPSYPFFNTRSTAKSFYADYDNSWWLQNPCYWADPEPSCAAKDQYLLEHPTP